MKTLLWIGAGVGVYYLGKNQGWWSSLQSNGYLNAISRGGSVSPDSLTDCGDRVSRLVGGSQQFGKWCANEDGKSGVWVQTS
jgi:hypothetical protein